MPFPKLSAVLNNCPLHALTPEIKNEVTKFATDEHYDNHHNDQYVLLKNKFAAFYELNPETLSWKQFANLLEHYNAFDTQIILGPVLRSFMQESMAQDEMVPMLALTEDLTTQDYINSKTELSSETGRYASLSPDELFSFVSKQLGFSLTYHPQGEPPVTFEAHHPISGSEIDIYHQGGIDGAQAGGHWERTNKGEASLNVQNQNDTQLNMIIQLLGENPAVNPCGFNVLKKHVRINEQIIEPTFQSEVDIAELNIAATQILKYLFNINSVPKTLAVSLIGERLSQDTQQFIREYEFDQVSANQIFERWIKASEGQKPLLNEAQQQLVNFLISKAPQSLDPEAREIKLDRNTLDNETALSEQLAKELHEQDLLALKEEERLQHESELLAQKLSAENKVRDLTPEEQDPSELLVKQLLEQERLAIEQEAKDILASEQLAKELTAEGYRSAPQHEEIDVPARQAQQQQEQAKLQLASEQLAKELEAKQQLEQQEQAELELANEQLAKELEAKQQLEQQEQAELQLASEQLTKELEAKQQLEQQEQAELRLASEQLAKELEAKQQLEQQEQAELQLASEQLAKELEAKQQLEQQEQAKHQLTNERAKQPKIEVNSPVGTKENNTEKPHTAKDKMQHVALKIEAKQKFQLQLDLLQEKINDIATRREQHRNQPKQYESLNTAWNEANKLHTELGKAGRIYFDNPTPRAHLTYKDTCDKLFKDAHVVLDQHRGWSEFLVNMAIGVLTLGAGLLVKGAINYAMNKSFFHVHNTDSSELLDQVQDGIKNPIPGG